MDDNCGDGSFGPLVSPGCRGGFDFTALFEESIMELAPAACFLLLVPFRTAQLCRAPDRVRRTAIYGIKLAIATALCAVQLAALLAVATDPRVRGRVSIAAATLSLLVGPAVVVLTHLEHAKSVRPSFLLSAYLFVSVLLDATVVRTEWLLVVGPPATGSAAYASILTVVVAVKAALLSLETVEKRRLLLPNEKSLSTEGTSGPFSRGFFVWLNGLLRSGYATLLTPESLPSIYEKIAAEKTHSTFGRAWLAKGNRGGKHDLLRAILYCIRWDIAAIVIPRLTLVALQTSQPFLIARAVMFVQQQQQQQGSSASAPGQNNDNSAGYGLIGAFAFVFVSAAVARSWYEHLGYRTMAMVRGGMTSLIYDKMTKLSVGESGAAVSIMGADVETLAESLYMIVCESWATTLQLAVATWLLAEQLGAVCVAPIIVGVAFMSTSFGVGRFITGRQKRWLSAIERRINFTSEILGAIKSVKMLGLTEKMEQLIARMRSDEISDMKKFRVLSSFSTCLINAPQFLGQFFTFAAYAIVAKLQGGGTLSVTQAITSMSLLNLLSAPLAQLLASVPQAFVALGCLQRIQEFLVRDEHVERRQIQLPGTSTSYNSDQTPNSAGGRETELAVFPTSSSSNGPAIVVRDCSFGWSSDPARPRINADLNRGSLIMAVGPVGCGKSTFLKALIGETTFLDGELRVVGSPRVAYCDQTSWIINGTIRENIIAGSSSAFSDSDEDDWYATVVQACDLTADLQQLPSGDATVVGSKGLKLSGGQKQRIAIARAVYARAPISVFDDVFSGLDRVTERAVFDRVFGREGLLRQIRSTVILATHSVSWLPEADIILAFGSSGELLEYGNFEQLRSSAGYVQRLVEVTAPAGGSVGGGGGSNRDNPHDFGNDKDEFEAHVQLVENEQQPATTAVVDDTENLRQTSDLAVWKYYAASLGWLRLATLAFFWATDSGFATFRYVWVTWWAERGADGSLGYWLGTYSA